MATTTVPSVKTLMKGIITPDGFEREETTTADSPLCSWTAREHPSPMLRLTSPDTRIEIHFTTGKYRRESYSLADGHVTFDTPMGERTFDRYGVEDSFYIDNPLKDYELRFWHGDRVVCGIENESGTVVDQGMERGERVRPIQILWDAADPAVPLGYTERELKRMKVRRADVIDRVNHTIRKIIEVRIPEARELFARSEKVPQIPFTVTPETKAQITKTLKAGGYYRFMPSGFGTGYVLTTRYQRGYSGAQSSSVLARFFGVKTVYVSTFDAD